MIGQAHIGISRRVVVIAAVLAHLVGPGAAPAGALFDSVSLHYGQGVDNNLRNLPGEIATWGMEWDTTYCWGLGLGKTVGVLEQGTDGASAAQQRGSFRYGYEAVLLRHYGQQSNAEVGGAGTLRTPDLKAGPVGVNFSAGVGLSYALGTPAYEDGPSDDPDRRYRLQLLALFELEWRVRGVDQFSVVTRIHHRSGVYGVIAPQGVGSNFMVAGIRYTF